MARVSLVVTRAAEDVPTHGARTDEERDVTRRPVRTRGEPILAVHAAHRDALVQAGVLQRRVRLGDGRVDQRPEQRDGIGKPPLRSRLWGEQRLVRAAAALR